VSVDKRHSLADSAHSRPKRPRGKSFYIWSVKASSDPMKNSPKRDVKLILRISSHDARIYASVMHLGT